jgi:hypothetical protein
LLAAQTKIKLPRAFLLASSVSHRRADQINTMTAIRPTSKAQRTVEPLE